MYISLQQAWREQLESVRVLVATRSKSKTTRRKRKIILRDTADEFGELRFAGETDSDDENGDGDGDGDRKEVYGREVRPPEYLRTRELFGGVLRRLLRRAQAVRTAPTRNQRRMWARKRKLRVKVWGKLRSLW